jgi:hypothetical protein
MPFEIGTPDFTVLTRSLTKSGNNLSVSLCFLLVIKKTTQNGAHAIVTEITSNGMNHRVPRKEIKSSTKSTNPIAIAV